MRTSDLNNPDSYTAPDAEIDLKLFLGDDYLKGEIIADTPADKCTSSRGATGKWS